MDSLSQGRTAKPGSRQQEQQSRPCLCSLRFSTRLCSRKSSQCRCAASSTADRARPAERTFLHDRQRIQFPNRSGVSRDRLHRTFWRILVCHSSLPHFHVFTPCVFYRPTPSAFSPIFHTIHGTLRRRTIFRASAVDPYLSIDLYGPRKLAT
jgi:hypothetical protein